MRENKVVITEQNGKYQITNDGIPELTLLGILECIVFEMKSAGRREMPAGTEPAVEMRDAAKEPVAKETVSKEPLSKEPESKETIPKEPVSKTSVPEPPSSDAAELRARIGNAVKAIRGLGGETSDFDVSSASDEELREELAALTEQYKRLKTSGGGKK